MNAPQDRPHRIAEEIEPPLRDLGLDLEAVELTPAGNRRVLRVAVDQDGGVTLDEVAEATRAVGEALDASDTMGQQAYTLEVTSRGVDRPLTHERHWRRNADRLVKVSLTDGSTLTGRILSAGPDDATVEVPGDGTDQRRTLAYAEVVTAVVQVELNRRPAPAAGSPDAGDTEEA